MTRPPATRPPEIPPPEIRPPETWPPGTRPVVAVLGGGQLGRMLGAAGVPLAVRCRFLDPVAEAPAGALGPLVVGTLGDERSLLEVAAGATVATYEWEGVPAAAARFLETRLTVRPGPRALDVAQDRLTEKDTFRRLGIPVPEYAPVGERGDLTWAVEAVGVPAVLKTCRGGYDGKGQVVLRSAAPAELDAAWEALAGERRTPLILEAFVAFDRELSVLAVRGADGATVSYPLVENVHRDGILRTSRAPAPGVTAALEEQAAGIATKLLDDVGYVGVLAVELFERDGTLLANEIAPRVHNSGHWTIEGAETSQFENHLRAILGWPLGSTAARGFSAMVNLVGEMPDRDAVLAIPGAHLHDYEKEPRPGRKLGHVTMTASTAEELESRLGRLRATETIPGF